MPEIRRVAASRDYFVYWCIVNNATPAIWIHSNLKPSTDITTKMSKRGAKVYPAPLLPAACYQPLAAWSWDGLECCSLLVLGTFSSVPGLFSVGYFPIANFLKDISLSDKCPSEFLPIMDFYPLCFAHQEKTLPGLIPITILPIYLWIFTYHIFVHHRIAHQTRIN